jgi:hypothetical protein
VQECGRKLGSYLRAKDKAESEHKRLGLFQRYIPEVSAAIAQILNGEKDPIEKSFYKALPNFVKLAMNESGTAEALPPSKRKAMLIAEGKAGDEPKSAALEQADETANAPKKSIKGADKPGKSDKPSKPSKKPSKPSKPAEAKTVSSKAAPVQVKVVPLKSAPEKPKTAKTKPAVKAPAKKTKKR